MKKKISVIIIIFMLMALLPFAAARCSGKIAGGTTAMSPQSTADSIQKTDDYCSLLSALTAAKYKDSYSLETVKALAIILNTNYKDNPKQFSKDDFLYRDKASGNLLEVYSKIESAVNSVKEKTLCKNNKAFYIPFAESSNGVTCKSSDYSYIQSVASPWDCFQKNFDESTQCVGVSLSGIDYLCKNGASAEDALLWYLPGFDISE